MNAREPTTTNHKKNRKISNHKSVGGGGGDGMCVCVWHRVFIAANYIRNVLSRRIVLLNRKKNNSK